MAYWPTGGRMMQTDITYEEWRKALELATTNDVSEGLTTTEIGILLNISLIKTQKLLREGVRAGTILVKDRYVKRDWDGRARHYKVYALK